MITRTARLRQVGSRSQKTGPVFQVGGNTPIPPTSPVFRVVLLHTEGTDTDTCPDSLCTSICSLFMKQNWGQTRSNEIRFLK